LVSSKHQRRRSKSSATHLPPPKSFWIMLSGISAVKVPTNCIAAFKQPLWVILRTRRSANPPSTRFRGPLPAPQFFPESVLKTNPDRFALPLDRQFQSRQHGRNTRGRGNARALSCNYAVVVDVANDRPSRSRITFHRAFPQQFEKTECYPFSTFDFRRTISRSCVYCAALRAPA